MNDIPLELTVNGDRHELHVSPTLPLVALLRDVLGLTGTKKGCGTGDCGSCTVLMNGKAVSSCLVLAADARGASITTVEGLSTGVELHPVQKEFIEHGAIQCGFCTPGMIMTAVDLLGRNTSPTENEVKEAVSGNLCRCTGYAKIIEAIMAAVEHESGDGV